MVRERVTFIHKPGSAVDPSSLTVSRDAIRGPALDAVREERLTFSLEELPQDLRDLLWKCRELHIRWDSPSTHDSLSPLYSRASPGLQVFFTPQRESLSTTHDLCATLQEAFGDLDCVTPHESFTKLSNDRFSQSAAFQYYSLLESVDRFVQYASKAMCPGAAEADCVSRVQLLSQASSLDLSYDAIGHTLQVTAIWPLMEWPLQVASRAKYRTEVGILGHDASVETGPEEVALAGLLTVLGTDSKPSPTAFSFPARHRRLEASFSAAYLQPTGLHPTLQLNVSTNKPPSEDTFCAAHAYLTLPRSIFADRYQLADELFLDSKNLTALRFLSQPVDLEAPEYAVQLWGSAVLLELSPPRYASSDEAWTAEIPLHLRYLAPAAGGYGQIEVPYPIVFWACAAEEGTKFPTNPFDRVNLGYDGLFGPRTVFWHVDPAPTVGDRLMNEIKVPVLDSDKVSYVNLGTGLFVLLGFAWVLLRLLGGYFKTRVTAQQDGASTKKTQ